MLILASAYKPLLIVLCIVFLTLFECALNPLIKLFANASPSVLPICPALTLPTIPAKHFAQLMVNY